MEKTSAAKHKRKKEIILIFAILVLVAILTFIETRITSFGSDFPVSSTVLMFILINLNLLLLLALILLVFRNLAKLYYEKKNNILGSKLKTRLTAAFITLALLPTSVLFFFSIHFISSSLAFWFNVPIEQTLDSSLSVGHKLYGYIESKNIFFAQRAAYQIHSRKLYLEENYEKLSRYTQVVQRAFDRSGVEVYSPEAKRISLSLEPTLENQYFGLLTSDELVRIPESAETGTIIQETGTGELVRTVCPIPYGEDPQQARAFLVITTWISPELVEDLRAISNGIEEYHQLKMAKKPAQLSNYIALTIVALLVIFCAIWFGFQLAESITIPLAKFAEGTQRVAQGDLNYQIDFKTDDELGMLIENFNSMTKELAVGREKLALSDKLLRQQYEELEKSRRYMEIVLKHISAGVISIDNQGIITTMNKAVESMLNMKSELVLNRDYRQILGGRDMSLAGEISKKIAAGIESDEFPVVISIDGNPRQLSIHFNILKDDTGRHIGFVLVFDDLTELEKAQRVAAWREVARRMAHEVKNPLTPIKLSAQRLKRKYGKMINDEIFDTCTRTIVVHVDLIRNMVNQFSTFARFPDANMNRCRIENIIEETLALYREGLEDVDIRAFYSDNLPVLYLDHQHMKQAFINLVDNAVAAVNKKGMIRIDVVHDPILKIVRIEIADNGKGISDIEKTKLFEPYFSTKKSGMGLGLAIVSSIITDHHGVIRVQDNKPAGAKFIIELPVT